MRQRLGNTLRHSEIFRSTPAAGQALRRCGHAHPFQQPTGHPQLRVLELRCEEKLVLADSVVCPVLAASLSCIDTGSDGTTASQSRTQAYDSEATAEVLATED